jgi:hypothetical protein
MKTYIIEQEFEDQKFEGPDIQADSWAEAETAAREIGFAVTGELDTRLQRA